MKKTSYVIMNILLAIGILLNVLILSLYQSVFEGQRDAIGIDFTTPTPLIYTVYFVTLILGIIAIVLINIAKKEFVQIIGAYFAIIFSIIIILTFFIVFYFGIANVIVGVGLITFAALFIKTTSH